MNCGICREFWEKDEEWVSYREPDLKSQMQKAGSGLVGPGHVRDDGLSMSGSTRISRRETYER
jgi:hypothetical protein